MYFGMTIVRCIFLQGLILLCRFQLKGAALSINLTEGLWHGTDFKCNSTVTLRCYVTPNSFLVQWKVGNPIGPHSDSDCYKFGCGISKTFPGRYTYSFDASSGVSDLKIVNVNVTDDNMTYQCNNASSTAEFKASVKVPPSSSATVNETKHFQNETEFKVTTSCIYPANLTKFSWHSSKIDGTIRREYSATTQNSTLCQALTNMCVVANKSEYVSSVLILPNLQTGQTGIQTIIKVEVIYDDKPLFNSTVGTYMDKAAVSEIPCSVDENCTATNSKCEILDAKCNCMPGYREDDTDGATCIIVLGSSCSTDNWNAVCIVDNSICGANSECECKAGYINSGVFCLKVSDDTNLRLGLGIGLGIGGGLIAAVVACFILFLKDGIQDVSVISRKSIDRTMTIKLQCKSRFCHMKTFHLMLNDGKHFTECKDGVIELTGLNLDSNYSASVFSTMCKFQSRKKSIHFDTKGRPFSPYNVSEDKTLRTESSVTLNWNRAKGPKHNFIIKYQRTKGRIRKWMFTERINDTRYTLDGLKPGTSYTLLIHAENDVGCSEDSEPLFVKTRALSPVPPEEFICESVKENEVILSWKPFKNIRKQQFILTFYNMSEELPPGQDRKDTEICIPYTGKPVMTYKVMELKPSSKYIFELYTSAGKRISERSAIASVETADRDEDTDGVHGKGKLKKTTSVFHIAHT